MMAAKNVLLGILAKGLFEMDLCFLQQIPGRVTWQDEPSQGSLSWEWRKGLLSEEDRRDEDRGSGPGMNVPPGILASYFINPEALRFATANSWQSSTDTPDAYLARVYFASLGGRDHCLKPAPAG